MFTLLSKRSAIDHPSRLSSSFMVASPVGWIEDRVDDHAALAASTNSDTLVRCSRNLNVLTFRCGLDTVQTDAFLTVLDYSAQR